MNRVSTDEENDKARLIARYLAIVEEQRAKMNNHDGGASPAAFKRTCIPMAGFPFALRPLERLFLCRQKKCRVLGWPTRRHVGR